MIDAFSPLLLPFTVVLTALCASVLASVAGFGGAVVLLPVLVWAVGVREAVPVLTVVQLVGNGARVAFNRRQLVWPVVGWFALGAVPLAVLGGVLFATAPASFLQRVLGGFLLLLVAYRHTRSGRSARLGLRGFAGVGALAGFLSAVVGTAGPLAAPFFLTYGLVKGAYIGTEACTALLMHAVKLGVYGRYTLLDGSAVVLGVAIGLVMVLGTYLGKRVTDRLSERVFLALIEGALVVSGLQLLWTG